MKIPVLETDEGILKTAIKLQAQVQVRSVPPLPPKYLKDRSWEPLK